MTKKLILIIFFFSLCCCFISSVSPKILPRNSRHYDEFGGTRYYNDDNNFGDILILRTEKNPKREKCILPIIRIQRLNELGKFMDVSLDFPFPEEAICSQRIDVLRLTLNHVMITYPKIEVKGRVEKYGLIMDSVGNISK
jgi:hypothetical protein